MGMAEDSSLITAINEHNEKKVKELLYGKKRKRADPNAVDEQGNTALYLAAQHGNLNITKKLLDAGANVNASARYERTALHIASEEGHKEIAELLLKHKADVNSEDDEDITPLMNAVRYSHKNLVEVLLKHNAKVDMQDEDDTTALVRACERGNGELVNLLLNAKSDVNLEDGAGRVALHFTVYKNRLKVAELLLEHGAAVDHKAHDGYTPIFEAAFYGHIKLIELLFNSKANINHKDNLLLTPLLVACCSELGNNARIVKFLLEQGAQYNHVDSNAYSAIFLTANFGKEEETELLIRYGANINGAEKNGWTPLSVAAFQGYGNIVQCLYHHGADINIQTNAANSPISLARDKEISNFLSNPPKRKPWLYTNKNQPQISIVNDELNIQSYDENPGRSQNQEEEISRVCKKLDSIQSFLHARSTNSPLFMPKNYSPQAMPRKPMLQMKSPPAITGRKPPLGFVSQSKVVVNQQRDLEKKSPQNINLEMLQRLEQLEKQAEDERNARIKLEQQIATRSSDKELENKIDKIITKQLSIEEYLRKLDARLWQQDQLLDDIAQAQNNFQHMIQQEIVNYEKVNGCTIISEPWQDYLQKITPKENDEEIEVVIDNEPMKTQVTYDDFCNYEKKITDINSEQIATELTAIKEKLANLESNHEAMIEDHDILMEDYLKKQRILIEQQRILEDPALAAFYKRFQQKLNELLFSYMLIGSGNIKHKTGIKGFGMKSVTAANPAIKIAAELVPIPRIGILAEVITGVIEKGSEISVEAYQHKLEHTDKKIAKLFESGSKIDETVERLARLLTKIYTNQIRWLTENGAATLAECGVRRIIEALRAGKINDEESLEWQFIRVIATFGSNQGYLPYTNRRIGRVKNAEIASCSDKNIFQDTGLCVYEKDGKTSYYRAEKYNDRYCSKPQLFDYRIVEQDYVDMLKEEGIVLVKSDCRFEQELYDEGEEMIGLNAKNEQESDLNVREIIKDYTNAEVQPSQKQLLSMHKHVGSMAEYFERADKVYLNRLEKLDLKVSRIDRELSSQWGRFFKDAPLKQTNGEVEQDDPKNFNK